MEFMNPYAMPAYQSAPFAKRPPRKPRRYAPYANTVKCGAESLKPFINLIDHSTKDAWEPCSKKATTGDVICSVHRKMLNEACARSGIIQCKTRIRVPISALEKGGCAFPPDVLRTNIASITKTAGKAYFVNQGREKVEIDTTSDIGHALGILRGAP